MRRGITFTVLAALASAALSFGAACGSSAPAQSGEEEPTDPALADVIYQGGASQKPLKALLAKTPQDNPLKGAEIDYPPDQVEIPPTPIPTFLWHPRGATAVRERIELLPPALVPPAPRERTAFAGFVGPLRELLGPERAAHAAEAPMEGSGYFLVFSTDTEPKVLRIFTSKTSYTPDAKTWDMLSSLGVWTTLTILTASFTKDQLSPTGGPFTGPPVAFCIAR